MTRVGRRASPESHLSPEIKITERSLTNTEKFSYVHSMTVPKTDGRFYI